MKAITSYEWYLAAIFFAVTAFLCVVSLAFNFNPFLAFGGGIAGIAFLYAAYRMPEFFFVSIAFIPQLKAYWPLEPIDKIVDLTGVMLVGLAIGLALRFLQRSAGLEQWRPLASLTGLKSPIVLFFLFAGVMIASYLHTSAPYYGGSKLLRFLVIGTLLFLASFILIRNEKDLRRVALLFVGWGLITAVQILTHLEAQNPTLTGDEDITRIGAGWVMGMTFVLLLYYRFIESDSLHRIVLLFGLPLLVIGLIASAARGPMVALLIVVPINFFFARRAHKLRTSFAVILLLAVSAYAAFGILLTVAPDRTRAKLNELISVFEGRSTSGSAGKRLAFYRGALLAIPDHPIVGRGIGSWGVFYWGSDQRNYPHNLFLEVAFEEGLIGLAVLWLFLAAIGDSSFRLIRVTGPRFSAFPSLVLYSVVVAMFSGDIDDDRMLWFWAGMTLAICRFAVMSIRERESMMRFIRRSAPVPAFRSTVRENRRAAIT